MTVLGGAVANLISSGISSIARVTGEWSDEPTALYTASFLEDDGQVGLIVTDIQLDQVNAAITSPEATACIQAYAIARLTMESGQAFEEANRAIRDVFVQRVIAANKDAIRDDTWEYIWDRVCAAADSVFRIEDVRQSLSASMAGRLRSNVIDAVGTAGPSATLPVWLRDYLRLINDSSRVSAALEAAADIRAAAQRSAAALRFDHVLDEIERPLADLYVDRTLRSPSGRVMNSSDLDLAGQVKHVVVTGDPGAGKTTLTQHLVVDMAERGVPIRVLAREVNHSVDLLVDEMVTSVRRDLQLGHVTLDHVETLLALGRVVVVFDGLDEITEEGLRRKFVRKIEQLVDRYPLVSILVTARSAGYERAPLAESKFERLKIASFDDDQVAEYAKKWFDSRASPELLDPFIRDVDPLPDIRSNPLMLSLICTLYKSRRQIPRSRREVYNQCADLLFMRWDSLRSIDQPVDHIAHGHDLIQDIAYFYYKSSAAQKGVERQQLIDIVGRYLQDSAGVLQAEARRRAAAFVEFCANRAWLLGRSGVSPGGADLFVFTHRTFMEFYAAERMAREDRDPKSLAQVMCDEYVKNPASVMPELVLASAEHVRRDASREILVAIKGRERLLNGRGEGRFLPLRLRAVSVLPIRPKLQDEILQQALSQLARSGLVNDELRFATFLELLELGRDPRARLEAHLFDRAAIGLPPSADQERWQHAFLAEWIAMTMHQDIHLYDDEWRGVALRIWSEIDRDLVRQRLEYRSYAFEVDRDASLEPQGTDFAHWVSPVDSKSGYPSAALRSVLRFLGGARLDVVDIALLRGPARPGPFWEYREEVADQVASQLLQVTWSPTNRGLDRADTAIAAVLLLLELRQMDESADAIGEELLGFLPSRAMATRQRKLEARLGISPQDSAAKPYEGTSLSELSRSMPAWFRRWVDGRLQFVKDSRRA